MTQQENDGGPRPETLLSGEKAFKDALGVKDHDLEMLYTLAYRLYQLRRYEEAERMFAVLCMYDHRVERFWLGLGACRQRIGAYAPAILAYYMAAETGTGSPWPPLYAAECYLALGLPEPAGGAMDAAARVAQHDPDPKRVTDRIESLRECVNPRPETTAASA